MKFSGRPVVFALLIFLGATLAIAEHMVGVESVLCGADLAVVGRIVAQGQGLTYALEVERYLKGRGPKTLTLIVNVGVYTDEKGRQAYVSSTGGVGATVGEELLAFLEPVNGGYVYRSGSGGRYVVETDPETRERFVLLRWKKKRYMRGQALKAFEMMEAREEPPGQTAKIESGLDARGSALIERVLIEDLPERLKEVWKGESGPDHCIPDRAAPDPNTASP